MNIIANYLKNRKLRVAQKDCTVPVYYADKTKLIKMMDKHESCMFYASDELKNDREVMMVAVKASGRHYEYASDRLKMDRELVLEAVKENGQSMQFVPEELKDDRLFILQAVRSNGLVLDYATDEYKNDREIVLEAVKQNGYSIKFASSEIQRVVDNEDPVVSLERMINSKKLATRLSQELKQKSPKQERGIKI